MGALGWTGLDFGRAALATAFRGVDPSRPTVVLMHNPDLLVLDEPFSGLDVTASLLFRTLLRMFAAGDRMVLFSTHRFDMVEKLCSRVVILSRGRVAAEHDMGEFRSQQSRSLEEVFVQTTGQDDFTPVARQILDLMQP